MKGYQEKILSGYPYDTRDVVPPSLMDAIYTAHFEDGLGKWNDMMTAVMLNDYCEKLMEEHDEA